VLAKFCCILEAQQQEIEMDKQPLALRQADTLEDEPTIIDLMNAASTIRHLHEVNAALLDSLLRVLRDVASDGLDGWEDQARAAIAKATGEQK
jgi:hypothetical protein